MMLLSDLPTRLAGDTLRGASPDSSIYHTLSLQVKIFTESTISTV